VFPNDASAAGLVQEMLSKLDGVRLCLGQEVSRLEGSAGNFRVGLGEEIEEVQAILVATGFKPFEAARKEEFGCGEFKDVITSLELEEMLERDIEVPSTGRPPERVALNHCVGSRDAKVGNLYCSRVCCTYSIHQAMEIRQRLPRSRVTCFYMDIRTYGRGFEELYLRAQDECGVQFVRGRIAEVHEDGGHLILRAEDTLSGQILRFPVDLLSLSVGMEPSEGARALGRMLGIRTGPDGFFETLDPQLHSNESAVPGIFLAGTATGPKSIVDTITDARSAAAGLAAFLS
jgi:heterodisulfide reductase subunit A